MDKKIFHRQNVLLSNKAEPRCIDDAPARP